MIRGYIISSNKHITFLQCDIVLRGEWQRLSHCVKCSIVTYNSLNRYRIAIDLPSSNEHSNTRRFTVSKIFSNLTFTEQHMRLSTWSQKLFITCKNAIIAIQSPTHGGQLPPPPFASPPFCFLLVVYATKSSFTHTITPSRSLVLHQIQSARNNARASSPTLRPLTTSREMYKVDGGYLLNQVN